VALFTFKDVLDTKRMDAQYLGAWDIWLAAAKLCVLLGIEKFWCPPQPVLLSIQIGGVSYFEIL
jgi:hypothetical protein